MSPKTESTMPIEYDDGFEIVEFHHIPALPPSTETSNPQVPNNSFATGQAPHTQNGDLHMGNFGLLACFPSLYSIFSPTAWRRNGQIINRNAQQDVNEDFEIPLECISVNFKEGYIGGGNQSSVFKGTWNGRHIALKKLNRASEVDIGKLVALDHENVVKTIGICSKDITCIVMEFCEKGSLFDFLSREHIGKHKFLRWSKEISSGMKYLHDCKIIHRDLKSPNVLVDGQDTLKICDFGSLYSCDKTYFKSEIMSVVGTTGWMAPEMLKNEPCSEKVDVWSFSVILWEILTQEIPYKNLSSMAIMFGVGSNNLRLHLPNSLPDTLKLIFKICFSVRSRNRPSFNSILNHLANLEVEMLNISEDAWSMRKEVWGREVKDESEKFRQNSLNGNNTQDANQEYMDDLVKKRINELRHAEEIRQTYCTKLERLDVLMNQVTHMLQKMSIHERKLNERERQLGRAETAAPPSTYYSPSPVANKYASASVPELKSVKLKKSTVTSVRGKKTLTDVYSRAGQRAVLTMQVDDDDNNNGESDQSPYESDAEDNLVNPSEDIPPNTLSPPIQERLVDGGSIMVTPKRRVSQAYSISSSDDERFVGVPQSRHSYGASSHQNSFEECCNSKFSSRATSARSSMNFAQKQFNNDTRANRNSIANLPPYDEKPSQFVCPCHAYEFRRNSTARISGISADSGVASTINDRQMSALTLNDECICQQTDLYRNQQARWSDGRIHRHHQKQSSASRTQYRPHNRRQTGSFTRNSPARRVTSATTSKRHRSGFDHNSTGCLQSVFANDLSIGHQMANSLHGTYNSQPKLSSRDEDEEMPQQSEDALSMKTIMESSSSTKKSIIMDQSSSTMASSLERSLEMAIADGLSDKESKLKLAKSTFRTHRRCLSNPTNTINNGIAKIVESTTESDNDPVYC